MDDLRKRAIAAATDKVEEAYALGLMSDRDYVLDELVPAIVDAVAEAMVPNP